MKIFHTTTSGNSVRLPLLVILSVFCSILGTNAQSTSRAWNQPGIAGDPRAILQSAKDIPNSKGEEVTVLLDEQHFEIDSQSRVTDTTKLVFRVNSAEGVENWGSAGAVWEPWHQERPQIRARVIAADGTVYMLDPKILTDSPATESSSNIYSEVRRLHGPLPGLGIGSVVEEEIVLRDTAPFFAAGIANREYIGRNVPVQQSRITIELPSTVQLHYAVHLLPSATIKKEEAAGRQRLIVDVGPMETVDSEFGNLPRDRPTWPHVDFATGESWKAVNDAYRNIVEASIHLEDVKVALPKIAKSASRDETIRATVSRLHDQIRYTGVELGESGLVPQPTAEILKRKFGDCKEKAALLVAMLRAQGIDAYLALVVADSSQDVEDDMPGMGLFDHAIVVVPGKPDVWIDATAEYSPAGTLPGDDQGRAALIIREGSAALVRTPNVASASNTTIEHREVYLADYGPARIVETTEPAGDFEGTLRRMYDANMKEQSRKELDEYMQETYLSERLTSVRAEHGADINHPYNLRLEAARARRGDTDERSAVVGIPVSQIFSRLPKALRSKQEEDSNDKKIESGSEPAKIRTLDFELPEAFTHVWQYQIIPPAGFISHGLPPNVVLPIGPATLTEEFKLQKDNSVQATLRFDTVKKTYTAEESRQLRAAILKIENTPMLTISFDDAASALLREGKIKESLAAYRQLTIEHPKEGLRRTKLGLALMEAGLGESARVEAKAAAKLEPTSAFVQRNLGWILQHDLIGRRFGRGFDLGASLAAYRKAKELDPKDTGIRADLAILLEHDKNGDRYTKDAKLQDAVEEYRQIKIRDKDNHNYDENLAYALIYAGRFKETREFIDEIGASDATRRGIFVAAVAGESGPEEAGRRSSEISSNEKDRAAALLLGGKILMNMRRYPESAALLQAGSSGQSNSPQLNGLIEALRKTKQFEDLPVSKNPAEAVVQRSITDLFSGAPAKEILALASKNSINDGKTEKKHLDEIDTASRGLRVMLHRAELPVNVIADLGLSNVRFSTEALEGEIYRVTMIALGAPPENYIVVKEDGAFKIVGTTGKNMGDIGREILARLDSGQLQAARSLLDSIRDDVSRGGGDDPFAGLLFPRFWTKGQAGDKASMENAAAAILVDSKDTSERAVTILKGHHLSPGTTEALFDLALAVEYVKEKKWDEGKTFAGKALLAEPTSDKVFHALEDSFSGLKDWAGWESMTNARLARDSRDLVAIRSQGREAEAQLNFAKARSIIKPLIDSGRASSGDMNEYAWDSLFEEVRPGDLEIGQRAMTLEKNDFSVMHTVACLFAKTGQSKEARELTLQAMNVASIDEPNSSIWLVVGLLAEQYGETEAARSAYAHVERGETEGPTSNFALMQQRIKVLQSEDKHLGN